MTSRFIRGAAMTGILTAASVVGTYGVAIGWNALKTVAIGETVAGIVETNKNLIEQNKQIAAALEAYQEKSDEKITQLQITTGTSNELLKLMSPRFQIEPEAVEKRITKEITQAPDVQNP